MAEAQSEEIRLPPCSAERPTPRRDQASTLRGVWRRKGGHASRRLFAALRCALSLPTPSQATPCQRAEGWGVRRRMKQAKGSIGEHRYFAQRWKRLHGAPCLRPRRPHTRGFAWNGKGRKRTGTANCAFHCLSLPSAWASTSRLLGAHSTTYRPKAFLWSQRARTSALKVQAPRRPTNSQKSHFQASSRWWGGNCSTIGGPEKIFPFIERPQTTRAASIEKQNPMPKMGKEQPQKGEGSENTMPKMGKPYAQNGVGFARFRKVTMPKMGKSLIYHTP
ncbi:hypothetical protein RIdsm_02744 [Roseovarius indicus]|uniref:Uncharacterized protein n=1 Tax=Roseovarius indicus TaxID=540747 RepID=A0A5P3ADU1_9RHOB|nr:hypothetical protein RIdsm_02744 [Roseovarius indicus]